MTKIAFSALLGMLGTIASAFGEGALGNNSQVVFASVSEGAAVLTARDDFVVRMSPFDRAARLKLAKDVSEEEYLQFVDKQVQPWNASQRQTVEAVVQEIHHELKAWNLPLPPKILFIHTTGREEGGAAYTRANAIVLPPSMLANAPSALKKTICHELFHVLSRSNADLRDKFYAAIGFVKCKEPDLPAEFMTRKLTNPDAPTNDHCIQLKVGEQKQWMIPLIFSATAKYDDQRGGEFFRYLQLKFVPVERNAQTLETKPRLFRDSLVLHDLRELSDFFEQVGRNTNYVIHPEEILADNFAQLMTKTGDASSPEILEKITKILKVVP